MEDVKRICMSNSIPKKGNEGMGVYLIEIAHHKYVGSATCFYSRWQDHRKHCRRGCGVNKKFQNAYNKYGENLTYFSILEQSEFKDLDELFVREKYWIEKINPDLDINKDPTIVPRIVINNRNGSKKVYQYDFDGNFIAEYESASEAARQLNVSSSTIAACARENPKYKSVANSQWKYYKVDHISKYTNNSALAKIVSVYVLDLETLKETKYDSIADAVRDIGNYDNFDGACAMMSSIATKKATFYQLKYMVRYEREKYYFSKRKTAVYNCKDKKVFANAKIAAETYKINRNTLREHCKKPHYKDWMYLEDCARQKFRESGKLQYWKTLIEDL